MHRTPHLLAAGSRIPGYEILGEIVRAPGSSMVRACAPGGRFVVLQLIRCRAPAAEEEAAWAETIRRTACATAEVRASLLPGIIDSGIVRQPDGSSVMFWVLPWHDAVERLGRADEHVRTVSDLLSVATDLLEILVARHDAGWVEPLLSESTIIVGHGEPARIAGIPIHVGEAWDAGGSERARRAPEEIARGNPSRTGDLWRLGNTLAALALALEERGVRVPGSINALIDSMSSPEPRDRPASAAAALANLKRMLKGTTSGIRWSDPYAEEPTLTSMPACREPAAAAFEDHAFGRAPTLPTARPATVRRRPANLAERVRRSGPARVVMMQALGVFIASALLTLGALQLLS